MPELVIERDATRAPVASPRELLPYAVLAGAVLGVVMFFVGAEGGAVSLVGDGGAVHEFVHDARHLLSFPCH
ncbi:MAG: CbtB-domain containing protein [Actinomycetota bacterium]|nr:CbtB-domain containing protein [Actinomycetota bacterium]